MRNNEYLIVELNLYYILYYYYVEQDNQVGIDSMIEMIDLVIKEMGY